MSKIIKNFNPAWGAAVMGTGVLSILLAGLSGGFAVAGFVLFWMSTLMLVYALICWILMWFIAPTKIRQIVNNAGMLVFLPTVPIGVVVWANNLMALHARFFPNLALMLPAILWIVASGMILALAVHFIDRVFANANIEIQHSTFGWLIPPVALLIIPLGAPLYLGLFSPAAAKAFVVLSFGIWGAGFFAYVFVNAAVTHRYFFHEMPLNQMAPSVWVGLGPIGAGAAGLLALSRAAQTIPEFVFLANFGSAFGLLLWGFGIIWYLVSLILTLRKAFFENIPYSMGWWAFTFPLGAYTLATWLLYAQTGVGVLSVIYWILLANLAAFWLLTAYRTTVFIFKGPEKPGATS